MAASTEFGHLLQLLREGLVFDRLLLGQTSQKCFVMRNTSLLPAKWRIAGLETLSPEFKITPSSGELPARQATHITVEFTAQSKKDLVDKLTLQVCNKHKLPRKPKLLRTEATASFANALGKEQCWSAWQQRAVASENGRLLSMLCHHICVCC